MSAQKQFVSHIDSLWVNLSLKFWNKKAKLLAIQCEISLNCFLLLASSMLSCSLTEQLLYLMQQFRSSYRTKHQTGASLQSWLGSWKQVRGVQTLLKSFVTLPLSPALLLTFPYWVFTVRIPTYCRLQRREGKTSPSIQSTQRWCFAVQTFTDFTQTQNSDHEPTEPHKGGSSQQRNLL